MQDLKRGIIATSPLTPGVMAFGLLHGMMARQVGFSPWEAWAMSLIVHASSVQFVALSMWKTGSAAAIVFTTLVINLRHLLMGASMAPHLRGLSRHWQALLALWMSDESYAVAIAEYERGRGSRWYFLGVNLGIYLAWQAGGLFGALLGAAIPYPGRYGLDLLFPLAFLGLLASLVQDRVSAAVALAAGGLALVGACLLAGHWCVVVAGMLGSMLGLLLERREKAWQTS